LLIGVGAAVLTAGVAAATIPDSSGTIHACYTPGPNGTFYIIDPSQGMSCSGKEVELDFNQRGPAGPPGAPGTNATSVAYQASDTGVHTLRGNHAVELIMPLPAGSYAITGKALLSSDKEVAVQCILRTQVGTRYRFDQTLQWVGDETPDRFGGTSRAGSTAVAAEVLADTLPRDGNVDLFCQPNGVVAGARTRVSEMHVVAIAVDHVQDVHRSLITTTVNRVPSIPNAPRLPLPLHRRKR
jgi:hypothetical protein